MLENQVSKRLNQVSMGDVVARVLEDIRRQQQQQQQQQQQEEGGKQRARESCGFSCSDYSYSDSYSDEDNDENENESAVATLSTRTAQQQDEDQDQNLNQNLNRNLTEQWAERERQKQVRLLLAMENEGVRKAYNRGQALRMQVLRSFGSSAVVQYPFTDLFRPEMVQKKAYDEQPE